MPIVFKRTGEESVTITNGDNINWVIEKRNWAKKDWEDMEKVYRNIAEYDRDLGNKLLTEHEKERFEYLKIGTEKWI